MVELSNKLWVIIENHFILTDTPLSLFSADVRKASANMNVLIDLGMVYIVVDASALPVPVLRATFPC